METGDIKPFPNPWHPEKDPVALKTLGKLSEELGECNSAVARCIIQGIWEFEPVTGKMNAEWLEDEIADVLANIKLVVDLFSLSTHRMDIRVERKIEMLRAWHKLA